MKGTYIFEFDITGRATISVDAENPEDAVNKLKTDYNLMPELSEWNVDYPNSFEELDVKDLIKYCHKPRE